MFREFKILIEDESDDIEWVMECVENQLSKYLPGDWYSIEEVGTR